MRRALLKAGTLTVRDVAAGEEPFLYSSGQRGPGYVMLKALVARQDVFLPLADALAAKLHRDRVSGRALLVSGTTSNSDMESVGVV